MQLRLKENRILPVIMTAVFSLQISVSFSSIEMMLASYSILACLLACTAFSILLIQHKHLIYRYDFYMLCYCVFIFSVSILNVVSWKDWLYITLSICLMLFIFNYYEDRVKYLLIGLSVGFSTAIYIQLIQNLTHPELWMFLGQKDNMGYLLGGNYNQIGCRILCALLTNVLCLRINKWFRINFIIVYISSIAILTMVLSMTSLSCCIFLTVLWLIKSPKLQRLAATGIIICSILFEIFVCFQGKGFENNDLARWFLVDVLGKDMTFTHRTSMWDSALRIITESPLYGYGYVDGDWYTANMSSFAIGPHNMILSILIHGGIIALLIYFFLFTISFIKLYRNVSRTSTYILTTVAVWCIMSLMEAYPITFIFYVLILAQYGGQIDRQITQQPKLLDA